MSFISRWLELVLLRKERKTICSSCETLKEQLEISNAERRRLLDIIVSLNQPSPPQEIQTTDLKPIMPRTVPWHIRKEMLENEDRKTAQIMKEKAAELAEEERMKNLAKLEKELGVEDAS